MIKNMTSLSSLSLLIVLFMSGCVSYSPGIGKEDVPDPKMGYLMGRFTHEGGDTLGIGLKISCEGKCEGKILRLRRAVYSDVIAIGVLPGKYQVQSVVFSYQNGYGAQMSQSEKSLDAPALIKPFNVENGKIYYIFDMLGEANFTNTNRIHWKVKNIRFNPESTKKEFFEAHPSFSGMQVLEPLRPE